MEMLAHSQSLEQEGANLLASLLLQNLRKLHSNGLWFQNTPD